MIVPVECLKHPCNNGVACFPCVISRQVGRMAALLEKWETLGKNKSTLCMKCVWGGRGSEEVVHNKRYLKGMRVKDDR